MRQEHQKQRRVQMRNTSQALAQRNIKTLMCYFRSVLAYTGALLFRRKLAHTRMIYTQGGSNSANQCTYYKWSITNILSPVCVSIHRVLCCQNPLPEQNRTSMEGKALSTHQKTGRLGLGWPSSNGDSWILMKRVNVLIQILFVVYDS